MLLTPDQALSIAEPERVWQVRRFCQVRAGPAHNAHGYQSPNRGSSYDDAGLRALMRCLLHELDADLAAVSLLDEENQYFLSVVHAATIDNPTVRCTDWFGCEQILFQGGICESTITHDYGSERALVFEILDLEASEATRSLPVVNGTTASFRYYAGVPITTSQGLNIGALFVFRRHSMSEPLSAANRHYLHDTARHTMNQLTQVLGSIENARSLEFNASILSLPDYDKREIAAYAEQVISSTGTVDMLRAELFEAATSLISRTLGLEHVAIESLFQHKDLTNNDYSRTKEGLQEPPGPRENSSGILPIEAVGQLMHSYPNGVILQLSSKDEGGVFIPHVRSGSSVGERFQLKLCSHCPGIQQCIFMPLRDSFYDRPTVFIFGWTPKITRVYAAETDLPSMSSFGIALMTQLRRLEELAVARKQADFLGSVSHEMRSPLHGILACIEYLQTTECSVQQQDWLESAAACGLQLKNNIDNVLAISRIGTSTQIVGTSGRSSPAESLRYDPCAAGSQHNRPGTDTMLRLVAESVDEVARLHDRVMSPSTKPQQSSCLSPVSPKEATFITLDATVEADFPIDHYSNLSVVVKNLCHNCLKFARPGTCVRISLQTDGKTIKMVFTDSGRGIAKDFLHHGLFRPFSQENPLDNGLGLGLTLVRRAIRELQGEIAFESDEAKGTQVCISVPRHQLARTASRHSDTAPDPDSLKSATDAICSSKVQLFAPTQWGERMDPRLGHSMEALFDSLDTTLNAWFGARLQLWENEGPMPKVLLFADFDTDAVRDALGDAYLATWKIVLCPTTPLDLHPSDVGIFARIVGPLNPFKLRSALIACYLLESETNRDASVTHILAESAKDDGIAPAKLYLSRKIASEGSAATSSGAECVERPFAALALTSKPDGTEPSREPRFLLVDDNAINLKVIGMFATKCSRVPAVLVGSGQGAIDAFKGTHAATDTAEARRFDIVILDLSMPEVSGFEVAATIRAMEASSDRPRTYIAALTGLVSDRDRNAAFAAGVDEYVTKPATVRDLKGVVSNWRKANSAG